MLEIGINHMIRKFPPLCLNFLSVHNTYILVSGRDDSQCKYFEFLGCVDLHQGYSIVRFLLYILLQFLFSFLLCAFVTVQYFQERSHDFSCQNLILINVISMYVLRNWFLLSKGNQTK